VILLSDCHWLGFGLSPLPDGFRREEWVIFNKRWCQEGHPANGKTKLLYKSDVVGKWTSLTTENRPTLPQYGTEGLILHRLCSRDVKRQ